MDVPARPQVAQELAPRLVVPGIPDRGDRRTGGVEDALPRHVLGFGARDLGADQAQQGQRRGRNPTMQELGPCSAALVLARFQPAPRHGQDRPAMAFLGQAQRHIDHGQAGTDQKQRLVRLDVVERAARPRVRNEIAGIVKPAIRATRRSRRQIAHGQGDDVALDFPPIGQQNAAFAVQQPHRLAAHAAEAGACLGRQSLSNPLFHIIAEQPARHIGGIEIEAAFDQRVSDLAAPLAQPFTEAGRQPDLHAADRHIEQVVGPAGAIGDAPAQLLLRFDDDDTPVRPCPVQLEPEQSAGKTAANDDDGGRVRGGHGRLRMVENVTIPSPETTRPVKEKRVCCRDQTAARTAAKRTSSATMYGPT